MRKLLAQPKLYSNGIKKTLVATGIKTKKYHPHSASSIISMHLSFMSDRCDEYTSAMTIDAFCKENIPNITLSKINDVNAAISEALSNVKDHAYPDNTSGLVHLMCNYKEDNTLVVTIMDSGCGIKNLEEAIKPGWSSKEGFAGMGFTVMDSMCDKLEVSTTNPDRGTKVTMTFDLNKDS